MARRTLQRGVTTLVGVGVIVVVASSIPNREWIAAAWHLYRLREDPGHLETILDSPDGLGRDQAIRKFLRSEVGRERFLEALVSAYEGDIREGSMEHMRSVLAAWAPRRGVPRMAVAAASHDLGEILLLRARDAGREPSLNMLFVQGDRRTGAQDLRGGHPAWRLLVAMERYLSGLRGIEFTSDRFPRHRFLLMAGDEAGRRTGLYVSARTGATTVIPDAEDRPGDAVPPEDLDDLRAATALLIEVDRGEATPAIPPSGPASEGGAR